MAFVDKLQNRLNHVQNFVDCTPALTITQDIESNVFKFDLSDEINADQIVELILKFRESKFPSEALPPILFDKIKKSRDLVTS